jgi:anaerobic magnesium-protoporphyrin IX monomethyl ester cyclase
MKVLLVYPPMDVNVPAKSTLLGIGYLASVIRAGGHYVEIKDLIFEKSYPNFTGWDVICVSAMFTNTKESLYNFLSYVKKFFPLAHLVVGGAHASTFPEEVIEYADTVVVGEGEEVICDIIENYKEGIIRTNRIKELDKIPFPAWDLMWTDIQEINRKNEKTPFHIRKPFIHMITSRGCPNACTFCAVKVAWGRQWIPRSAKNVVDEIQELYNLGFREIHFNDDNCSINKERMYEICQLILSRKIEVKIACPTGIHIGTLDKNLLKLMKQTGFYRLCFGIETGSPQMQKTIKKNINLEKAKQVIRDANDLGYWTSATFIFDFPKETEQDVKATMDFVKESQMDFPIFYNLIPQPKTEIYAECHCSL